VLELGGSLRVDGDVVSNSMRAWSVVGEGMRAYDEMDRCMREHYKIGGTVV
jgi:hypothetical protein